MNPCNGTSYPIISPTRKARANGAWQKSTVQKGVPSFPWREVELAAALLQAGIKLCRGQQQGGRDIVYLFPNSKVYCFVQKGGKTFRSPAAQLGCFTKVIPAAPGRNAQRAPFSPPLQNVFLNKVFKMCSVRAPQLCAMQGTL